MHVIIMPTLQIRKLKKAYVAAYGHRASEGA